MRSPLKQLARRVLAPIVDRLDTLRAEIEHNRMLIVQPRIREFRAGATLNRLADAEFRVFSQWGEDGIIQYLLARVPITHCAFVEFGVENYRESNTRFLLMNDNWRGLVIDADPHAIAQIQAQEYMWRHDLTTVCAFVTRENINRLLADAGFSGDLGLLSIDLDGNDYWVWQAIDVASPRIVVIEYNSLFGAHRAVTVPYDSRFRRGAAHASHLYFGASLKALCLLAADRGYVFVGSNSAGNNAFFVRSDVAGGLPALSAEEGYVESRMRESRDARGRLSFVSGAARRALIADMPVLDVETSTMLRVGELP